MSDNRDKPIDMRRTIMLDQIVSRIAEKLNAEIEDRDYGWLLTINLPNEHHVSHAYTKYDVANFTEDYLMNRFEYEIEAYKQRIGLR